MPNVGDVENVGVVQHGPVAEGNQLHQSRALMEHHALKVTYIHNEVSADRQSVHRGYNYIFYRMDEMPSSFLMRYRQRHADATHDRSFT